MKMKEVEQIVGLPRSNIRFYEDEGLISPERKENNYREYSESDVQKLLEIKKLRLLGISIHDICLIYKEEISLEKVFKHRLLEIEQAEQDLKEMREICELAIANQYDVHHLDLITLDVQKPEWQSRLHILIQEDLVAQKVDKKKLNFNVMSIYVIGTLIGLCVMFGLKSKFCDAFFMDRFHVMIGMAALAASIFIFIAQKFTSSMKSQFVLTVIAMINQPIFMFTIATLLMRNGIFALGLPEVDHYQREVSFTIVLLFALVVFVILIFVCFQFNQKVLQSKLSGFIYSGAFAVVVAVVSNSCQHGALLFSENIAQFILAWFYAAAISLIWISANSGNYLYNMYHAVCTGVDLLNVQGVVFDLRSRYGSYNMRRTAEDDAKIYHSK